MIAYKNLAFFIAYLKTWIIGDQQISMDLKR